jgi:hypothetical protein
MTNALMQGAYQTPLSRNRIMARYRAFGPPTELPELNSWSIERHAGHLAECNSLMHFVGCVPKTVSACPNGIATPISRPTHQAGMIRSHPVLGGLHHHYVRI